MISRQSSSLLPEILIQLHIKISTHRDALIDILTDYETYQVAQYEIERCLQTIETSESNLPHFLQDKKILNTVTLLPTNLPLYSLLLFAIIPSLMSEQTLVRPNAILQAECLIERLAEVLSLSTLFPSIALINQNHQGMVPYFQAADLVIFTGKPSNAENVLKNMKPNAALVINGAGHNPVVIDEDANIDEAINGCLFLKTFNGGQDCAGPDAILVHETLADRFIKAFTEQFCQAKTGAFKSPDTVIGPISRFSELQRHAETLFKHKDNVVAGGSIDYQNCIVAPAVIVSDIKQAANYKEMYGPIAFIHTYKTDLDLASYFEDKHHQYQTNRMYVTTYGQCHYVKARDDKGKPGAIGNVGIVLANQTIHDAELGSQPYGGFSMGASCVVIKTQHKTLKFPQPIYLPEVIQTYLQKQPFQQKKLIDTLSQKFKDIIKTTFENHVSFAFIFGSAVRNALRTNTENSSDLDTFVCLKDSAPTTSTSQYLEKLAELHQAYGLKVDNTYPAEIMSLSHLKHMINAAHDLQVSLDEIICGEKYDQIFWINVLTQKHIGSVKQLTPEIYALIGLCHENVNRLKRELMMQISSTPLPLRLQQLFETSRKDVILDKLKSISAPLVLQHLLRYEGETAKDQARTKQFLTQLTLKDKSLLFQTRGSDKIVARCDSSTTIVPSTVDSQKLDQPKQH